MLVVQMIRYIVHTLSNVQFNAGVSLISYVNMTISSRCGLSLSMLKFAFVSLPVSAITHSMPTDFCICIMCIRALHFLYILLNVCTAVLLFNQVHCFCVRRVCPASQSFCTNLIANSRVPKGETGRKERRAVRALAAADGHASQTFSRLL